MNFLDPKVMMALIALLKEIFSLLKGKSQEYKDKMDAKSRKVMLTKDIEAIKKAFKEKDEAALNRVFNSDKLGMHK